MNKEKFKCYFFILSIPLFLLGNFSCKEKSIPASKIEKYKKIISDPSSGLKISHRINGYKITGTYLPVDYLIYNQWSQSGRSLQILDSIRKNHSNTTVFLLNIAPDPSSENQGDIMQSDVNSYEEFAKKIYDMNFNIENSLSLHIDEEEYKPSIVNFEDTQGLRKDRDFMIYFSIKDDKILNSEQVELIYSDEWFGIGTCHFLIETKNIQNIPTLDFNN